MSQSAAVHRRLAGGALAALVVAAAFLAPAQARAQSPNLVVSQVYGGGGNTGATYTHDYVQLFNRSSSPVPLGGLSLQYASATGTGNFGANTAQSTDLPSVVLSPGRYFLVRQASGGTNGAPLPTADLADDTPINMAAGAGKVALVSGTTSLGCNGASTPGSTPCDAAALARIIDLVGYGNANFFEGAGPAPTLSSSSAALRGNEGCVDTDNNASDFVAGPPAPASPPLPKTCDGDTPPAVSSVSPANGATAVALDANLVVTFSEPVDVSGSWFSLTCGTTNHPASVTGGPTSFVLDPASDFAAGQECTFRVVGAQVTDQDANDPPDAMSVEFTSSFTTQAPPPPLMEIHELQGSAHLSPLRGEEVSIEGIVTGRLSNGFYMQDPTPDADPATSDGLFVFTGSAPTVTAGKLVRVSGEVAEFRPGGASSANLTTTEIVGPSVTVLPGDHDLPAATVIGAGGRMPPTSVIDDDAAGSVETSGTFDPATDGIDFYESMEGMRVQVNDAVAVGPTNSFGEIPVLADGGTNAGPRTARGGIVITPDDFNPERILIDDTLVRHGAAVNVGDSFPGATVGVLDYSFGNFKLNVSHPLSPVSGGLDRETTAAPGGQEIVFGTYNVENLNPASGAAFAAHAEVIVDHLRSPDLLAVEEIQDNDGTANSGNTDASHTWSTLIAAIQAAGGPLYEYRQIDPVNNEDGGVPGGNIRVGFLIRTDRGLTVVDRPGGSPTAATTVVDHPSGPQLSFSPGRIEPASPAFENTRKSLALELRARGKRVFAIVNHFSSKGGDDPLFGRFQPPVRRTETDRHEQAQVVNDFVDAILAADPAANVLVLGDINDFEFSRTVEILSGGVLHNLMDSLPKAERYSYVFEGNSQVLDQTLASPNLASFPFVYDVVHVNSEFATQTSDHEPQVARFVLNEPPVVSAGGPYSVPEGGSVALGASATDEDGDAVALAWDLDGDGTFETPGAAAVLSAAALDGPSKRPVSVQASDGISASTAQATVTVVSVAPSATFSAPDRADAGFPLALSLSGVRDPSAADTAAGFSYAFDCGAGYGAFGAASTASCATGDVGVRSVGGKVRDKDGGATEYRATVAVEVSYRSLCTLTRAYARERHRVTAKVLCGLLARAEEARNHRARRGLLHAYRSVVRVHTTGKKAFTPEEAATLIRLSRRV